MVSKMDLERLLCAARAMAKFHKNRAVGEHDDANVHKLSPLGEF